MAKAQWGGSHLKQKYFEGLSRNTVLLACASAFTDISTEMLYPILPIFLIHTLGASGSVVGFIEGIAQASQNIFQGFSGSLSDRLQKRKLIALIGYFLSAVGKPAIGLSGTWQVLLCARFVDRFGAGIRSAPRDALLASSVDDQHRGKAFGLEGFGDNLGAFFGPLLTALFILLQVEMHSIFYLSTIPGFLAFFTVFLVQERVTQAQSGQVELGQRESGQPESNQVKSKISLDVPLNRFPRTYWKYLLATALFSFGNSSNAFLILQTREKGVSLSVTIIIYAAFNLVAALVSYPAGYLSDHLGRRNILFASFAIFAVTYFGFAFTNNIVLIAILFISYGIYQGTFRSVGKAFAADLVPKHLQASGVGWYSATMGLLGLFASAVAGLLWDQISHESVFIFGGISAVMGMLSLLILMPAHRVTTGP